MNSDDPMQNLLGGFPGVFRDALEVAIKERGVDVDAGRPIKARFSLAGVEADPMTAFDISFAGPIFVEHAKACFSTIGGQDLGAEFAFEVVQDADHVLGGYYRFRDDSTVLNEVLSSLLVAGSVTMCARAAARNIIEAPDAIAVTVDLDELANDFVAKNALTPAGPAQFSEMTQ